VGIGSRSRAACGAVVAAALIAAGVTAVAVGPAGAAPVPRDGFADTAVLTGLDQPTALAFAPDGEMFVAEKSGLILRYDTVAGGAPTTFADLRTQTHNFWDRGLLGLTVDPQFPSRPYVYALYTYDATPGGTAPAWGSAGATSDGCPSPPGATTDGCVVQGRLSRLTDTGGTMSAETVLVQGWCQQFPSHSVGTVAVGRDGALYASAGEGANFGYADYGQQKNPCGDPPAAAGTGLTPPDAEGGALRAQSVRRPGGAPVLLNGSVIRVDPDTGDALAGGPFTASADPNARRIIAYGMRNPFRFTTRPGTDELWIGDVGWSSVEEINRIPDATNGAAENFGWPCYEGNFPQPAYQSANLTLCNSLYASGSATAPYFSYRHDTNVVAGDGCATGSSSISGLAFQSGTAYPADLSGALFFSDYSRNCIWVMRRGADGQPDPTQITPFVTGADGVVQLDTGPDGQLYYVTLGGEVHQVRYLAGNHQPVAHATATPASGPVGLTVQFDASTSTDADGDPLTYAWDLNGDGQFDDATTANPQWTYDQAQAVTARVLVSDGHGGTGTDQVAVTAGNPPPPPAPVIDTPTTALHWAVGDTISFSGHATDGTGAALPDSALTWHVVMYHCPSNCHTHPIEDFTGVASGQLPAPDHEYPSYFELVLTARDASGNTASTTLRLDPLTVDLGVDTEPQGLPVSVLSAAASAPVNRTVIVGSAVSVSAPLTQSLNGRTYDFVSWSDGGAATHNVAAGPAPPRLVARYRARPQGLVAGYGFEEGSGSVTADYSAHGNTGSLAGGAAWTAAGRFGRALTFNGSSSVVSAADSPSLALAPGMTLQAWVRPTAAGGTRAVVVKEGSSGPAFALYAGTGNGGPTGSALLDGTVRTVATAQPLPLNAWSHLALAYDGAALLLYVNGTPVASTPATGSLPTSSGPLRIGTTASGQAFAGQLDEVRVYDRGLSTAEIGTDLASPVVRSYPPTGPGLPAVTAVDPYGTVLMAVNGSTVGVRTAGASTAPVTVGPREQPGSGITGAPSVVQDPASGRVLVFGRGGGNVVYYQWRNASGPWSGWLRVPGSAAATSPTAILHNGHIDLFYPGADGVVRHHTLSGSTAWSGPETLPGRTNRQLSGYPLPGGQLRLWAVGTNAALYAAAGDTGHWPGWSRMPGAGTFTAAAGTTGFDATQREDVFAIGTAGRLYQGTFTGNLTGFGGWHLLESTVTAGQGLAATVAGRGRVIVLAGSATSLRYRLYANGRWSGMLAMP
jgi:glucose/arabinose dehydrogenase